MYTALLSIFSHQGYRRELAGWGMFCNCMLRHSTSFQIKEASNKQACFEFPPALMHKTDKLQCYFLQSCHSALSAAQTHRLFALYSLIFNCIHNLWHNTRTQKVAHLGTGMGGEGLAVLQAIRNFFFFPPNKRPLWFGPGRLTWYRQGIVCCYYFAIC